MKSLLRLFKAVKISSQTCKFPPESILELTIEKGFVFSPEVAGNYSEQELLDIAITVDSVLSLSASQMNSSFHKSWNKVASASGKKLLMEQLITCSPQRGFP